MGLFRKRGIDVIDFTDMSKRGLLKLPIQDIIANQPKINAEGLVDFSNVQPQTSSVSAGSSAISQFGFLDSLASTASSTSPLENNIMKSNGASFNELRLKIDDFDFKLGQLMERLGKIETKLLDFESRTGV